VRKNSAVPGPDVIKLLDAAIFNVIVGNADAHGKNFSFLYQSSGPRLAPLYDLLCTAFYPELSATFAMKIGRQSTLGGLDSRGWKKFAEEAGLGWPFVRQRVGEVAEKIDAKIATVAAGITALDVDRSIVHELANLIGSRVGPCVTSATR
jgi:serine/threonine-protein kinase HipA